MHLVVVLAKSQDFDGLEWNVTAFAPSPFAIVVGVEKESCFRAVEVLISCPYKMDDGKVRNFLSWEEWALQYASDQFQGDIHTVALGILRCRGTEDAKDFKPGMFCIKLIRVVHHLRRQENMPGRAIDFTDEPGDTPGTTARAYAETLKRHAYETLWLLQQSLPQVSVRKIGEYMAICVNVRLANELAPLATILAAYAHHGVGWKDIPVVGGYPWSRDD